VSTPEEKEVGAGNLRELADRIEVVLDPVPGWSRSAWRCPAADGFEAEALSEASRLGTAADTLRGIAAALDSAAVAQRTEEALARLGGAEPASALGAPGADRRTPVL
jgi:hypothetical protein